MNVALIIASKEIRDGLRNRWVVTITALLALFALTLAFLGTTPTGVLRAGALTVTVVSLSSLSIFLLPLIALLLSFDAIVGEATGGTLGLLLAYPVARWQVVIGKFLGHSAILALATTIGYGCAGAAIAATAGSGAGWGGFSLLIFTSILLGTAFVSIGYVISVVVSDRSAAVGFAIGVWLGFVLIYDMVLLGILAFDQGRLLNAQVVNWLLLFNPADAYRMFNLGATPGARLFSGMAGLAADLRFSPQVMAATLVLWTAIPLGVAIGLFQRKQI